MSLAETVLATAFLGTVMIVLLNLFPAAWLAIRHAEQRFTGHTLARSLAEEQVAGGFARLTYTSGKALPPLVRDGLEYRPTLRVAKVDGSDENLLRSVQVTVEWKFRDQVRTVTYEVYVHNLPD
jgi:hypothetical protein